MPYVTVSVGHDPRGPGGPKSMLSEDRSGLRARAAHTPGHHLGKQVVQGLVGVGDQQGALAGAVVVQHLMGDSRAMRPAQRAAACQANARALCLMCVYHGMPCVLRHHGYHK